MTVALCLYALGPVTLAAAAPAETSPRPYVMDRNSVFELVRSTMIALHQANVTGNYTVLRDLGAPGFREANTSARLAEIFANLRNQQFDLSGVLILEPQLTTPPELDASGKLHMAGFFPSVPLQVNFELLYAANAGRWQLFGIGVNIGQTGPVAPSPPQLPPQTVSSLAGKKLPPHLRPKPDSSSPATKEDLPAPSTSPSSVPAPAPAAAPTPTP